MKGILSFIALTVVALVAGKDTYFDEKEDWWKSAVIYQIYPRSFKDSDGDGVGDLKGIIEKADYLGRLGVNAVWLSPIYPSGGMDFGYDITNFNTVDPLFGTLTDFQDLVKALREKGIKIIMDFVPNHTSNKHPWFQAFLKGQSPYTNYYVTTSSSGGKPYNNWTSLFGGSAWEQYNGDYYYLHQFLKEQPDLNYDSDNVKAAMKDVLELWLGLGVDGFRMDAVFALYETNFYNEPMDKCDDPNNYGCYTHKYTADQPGTFHVLSEFRNTLDNHKKGDNVTRLMMTESYNNDLSVIMKYYGTKEEPVAHFPFNFDLITKLNEFSTAEDWKKVITDYMTAVEGVNGWPNWVLGNHDQHRVASRFGVERADSLNILALTLKGTAVTYNGEELAMEDSQLRMDQAQDPQGKNKTTPEEFLAASRDPERGPMCWNDTQNAGFTRANQSWLPVSTNYWQNNYKNQNHTINSHVNIYRRMLKLRQSMILKYGDCTVDVIPETNILAIFRSLEDNPSVITLINFGFENQTINLSDIRPTLPAEVHIYATSGNFDQKLLGSSVNTTAVEMGPLGAVVMITQSLETELKVSASHMMKPKDYIGLF